MDKKEVNTVAGIFVLVLFAIIITVISLNIIDKKANINADSSSEKVGDLNTETLVDEDPITHGE